MENTTPNRKTIWVTLRGNIETVKEASFSIKGAGGSLIWCFCDPELALKLHQHIGFNVVVKGWQHKRPVYADVVVEDKIIENETVAFVPVYNIIAFDELQGLERTIKPVPPNLKRVPKCESPNLDSQEEKPVETPQQQKPKSFKFTAIKR